MGKYIIFSYSLLLFASRVCFSMSRYWILLSFLPASLIYYTDRKYVPYGELENFYNYVYERRKAEGLFKLNHKKFEDQFSQMDQELIKIIKSELLATNKTLYEVSHELDETYLQAAIKSQNQ